MDSFVVISGKKVKLSDETVSELKKALISEETYSVGDILVNTKWGQVDRVMVIGSRGASNKVGLLVLEGSCSGKQGILWNSRMEDAENLDKITKEEMQKLTSLDWEKVSE